MTRVVEARYATPPKIHFKLSKIDRVIDMWG
jgi:hypothetical protein